MKDYKNIVPDTTISIEQRNEYGYDYNGMLPLNVNRALELFDGGEIIYLLYPDNTEAQAEKREDISNFNGLYGIETDDWLKSKDYSSMLDKLSEQEIELEFIMPDPAIGFSKSNLFGYSKNGILPLTKNRALELYDADHTIYNLFSDGTETMALHLEEIEIHNGIFGIETAEWLGSLEYAQMIRESINSNVTKEALLIYGSESAYGVYRRTDNEIVDSLTIPEVQNYKLIYTEVLKNGETSEVIQQNFKADKPIFFGDFDVKTGDVVVLQCNGVVNSFYVDQQELKELPSFLGNETVLTLKNESIPFQKTETIIINEPVQQLQNIVKAPILKEKLSILAKLNSFKNTVLQSQNTDKNTPKRDNFKEV